MDSPSATEDRDSAVTSIAAVRQAWLNAVRSSDVERLASLVTDDVVVVHGNGRCVHGKYELKADFLKAFEAFSIDQVVASAQVVVRGRWGFEISDVESVLSPHLGGESKQVHSFTVVALNQQPDGSWKVGRVLGLLDSP